MKVSRIVVAGAAALAACGVLGMVPAAAGASSTSAATWTQQHPASSPRARFDAATAYDAATGNVVLFAAPACPDCFATPGPGGDPPPNARANWTQQAPAASPSARDSAEPGTSSYRIGCAY